MYIDWNKKKNFLFPFRIRILRNDSKLNVLFDKWFFFLQGCKWIVNLHVDGDCGPFGVEYLCGSITTILSLSPPMLLCLIYIWNVFTLIFHAQRTIINNCFQKFDWTFAFKKWIFLFNKQTHNTLAETESGWGSNRNISIQGCMFTVYNILASYPGLQATRILLFSTLMRRWFSSEAHYPIADPRWKKNKPAKNQGFNNIGK